MTKMRLSVQTCNRKSSSAARGHTYARVYKGCKAGTRVVGMRKIVLTRVANSESESTKGSRRKGGRSRRRHPRHTGRLIDNGDGFVSRSESVVARRGSSWLLSTTTTTPTTITTWIARCCPVLLDDEHEDASRRRAFRMTKAEETEGTCPAAKCGAAVDGDEKDERK